MRRATALTVFALMATTAQAADYLRGPLPEPAMRAPTSQTFDWSGFTIAAMGVHGTGTAEQYKLGTPVAASAFPDLAATSTIAGLVNYGRPTMRGNGFSVMMGYNTMWDDVVIGAEAEYTKLSAAGTSTFGPVGRNLSVTGIANNTWDTTVSGSATTRVRDYTVLRTRVGASFDRFLPYVSLGIAAARITNTTNLTGTTQQFYNDLDPITQLPRSTAVSGVVSANTTARTNTLTWGYAFGMGVDVAVTDNIFLRGQYEYLGFGGTKDASVGLNTFKGGAGLKF